jgi:hypothetical protein
MQVPEIAEKAVAKTIATMLARYGVKTSTQVPEFRDKMKATMLEKYGYEHAMHVPEIFERAMKNCYKTKVYTFPSGNEALYQGYENYCIDELLTIGIKEEEISMQFLPERRAPVIDYTLEHIDRRYYPDFYIPHLNLIIEVKSQYTFTKELDKNFAKKIACLEQGYKFEFWIYDKKGIKIKTI